MVQPLLIFSDWGILILRVVLGFVLVRHGLPKLSNLKGTGEWLQGVGFKPGIFWAVVVGVVEFFGGLALVFGLFTQIAAILIAGEFLVLLLKFRRGKMFVRDSATELEWMIFVGALILVTLGGGSYGLDSSWGVFLY